MGRGGLLLNYAEKCAPPPVPLPLIPLPKNQGRPSPSHQRRAPAQGGGPSSHAAQAKPQPRIATSHPQSLHRRPQVQPRPQHAPTRATDALQVDCTDSRLTTWSLCTLRPLGDPRLRAISAVLTRARLTRRGRGLIRC